jgi:hypothetical protein
MLDRFIYIIYTLCIICTHVELGTSRLDLQRSSRHLHATMQHTSRLQQPPRSKMRLACHAQGQLLLSACTQLEPLSRGGGFKTRVLLIRRASRATAYRYYLSIHNGEPASRSRIQAIEMYLALRKKGLWTVSLLKQASGCYPWQRRRLCEERPAATTDSRHQMRSNRTELKSADHTRCSKLQCEMTTSGYD